MNGCASRDSIISNNTIQLAVFAKHEIMNLYKTQATIVVHVGDVYTRYHDVQTAATRQGLFKGGVGDDDPDPRITIAKNGHPGRRGGAAK